MKEIILGDTEIYGPVSTQLQNHGKDISDSWYRMNQTSIWEEFKLAAPNYYRLVSCEELDGDNNECGLCAHEIRMGNEIRAIVDPFVANHPELDATIVWPKRMVIGSTCVQMLNLDSYVVRFVKSCLGRGWSKIRINEHGLVRIGDAIVAHPENWAYSSLVLPHSVFTCIPADIMEECCLKFYLLKNPFDPKHHMERTLMKSFSSSNGKWSRCDILEPSETLCCTGMPHNKLASVLNRQDAVKIKEVFKNRTLVCANSAGCAPRNILQMLV